MWCWVLCSTGRFDEVAIKAILATDMSKHNKHVEWLLANTIVTNYVRCFEHAAVKLILHKFPFGLTKCAQMFVEFVIRCALHRLIINILISAAININ